MPLEDSNQERTPLGGFVSRQLQELEKLQEEQEDKVRLSVYFILAYLAYLIVSFVILKFVSKFDVILGLVRFMRKTNSSMCCIKTTTVFYLAYFLVCPIIIALAWSLYIYDKSSEDDNVIAGAIFLMIMFSTFVLLGAVVWYGAKWHVSKAVMIFLGLGALSAWLFTITVALTKENYTFQGVSAILLATNFIPACYILQKKTVWKDISLFALFKTLAKRMSEQTEQEHNAMLDMTPVQKRDKAEDQMQEIVAQVSAEQNKFIKYRILAALIVYGVTLGVYLGVFWAKEDDETVQGLAILNPIFILVSDIVVLSLREQTVKIRAREERQAFIYSPTFQSVILLFLRVLLCYNKDYWLMNQALVYFIVQGICAYDATQTVFLTSENVRDEQTDIIEILRVCPVLQAKVQNQLPELKTGFEFIPATCCCDIGNTCQWRKFRTQVASFIYFLFFIGLNYLCSTEPDKLRTQYVVFYNEVGQWVYGYFAIAVDIVIVFYILWYRSFKNSGYVFTCSSLLLYLLLQTVSVVVGMFFWQSVDYEIDIIITSFVILPIVLVTFSAFFGIWLSNDFNGYEHNFLQGKAFKPEEIEAYNKLGCWEKLKHGAWRPRTKKDWGFFFMLFFNIISIFVYMIMTAIQFKPVYVSITISLLILVFETSFITIWKYKAMNYKMSTSVVTAALVSVITFVVWIIYMVIVVLTHDDEPDIIKAGSVLIAVAYFVGMIAALLYLEYQSVNNEVSKLTCSFWILFSITYLILIGVGVACVYWTDKGLLGIVWIAVCIYVLLNLLLYKYKRIIDVLFSVCFIIAGVFLLMTSDDNDQSFQGISVLYFGMFILSFGSFCQEYVKNKLKKRRSIFMNAPEVLPMLEYDLDTAQMKDANAEPMLFFFFIYVVLLWAFSATIIADKSWRYIPLSLIGITLAFAFIYIIEKNVNATTVDRKFFKQATQLFYISCLVTATEYKKKWRNADRDIKDVVSDPEREFIDKEQFEKRTVYFNELMALQDWAQLIGLYKKDLGFVGMFESMSVNPDRNNVHSPLVQVANDSSQNPIVNAESQAPSANQETQALAARFVSITGDPTLIKLDAQLKSYVGKPTKEGELVDTWCDLMDKAREEDYYDKKYWAFLNGYLNLKMTQLLENEMSVIETSVKMFIKELKTKNPNANLDEKMSVGKFLDEIKDEPDVLVGFSVFLAEEFLSQNSKSGEKKDDTQVIPVNDSSTTNVLKQGIEQMKTKFGAQNKDVFDMEAFQKESQKLIGNILLERQTDVLKQVEESRKRDETRDARRRAIEEARRFEQEQRERRRNIKMDEVQEVGAEEDEKLLKVEGDQKLNALRSSGRNVHEDDEFAHEKAKGELKDSYDYIRANEIKSSNASGNAKTLVFADGVSANDIRQGSLGDCYLLSAMSIIAHSRPELIKKIFHPESRSEQREGMYSIMLYQGKVPEVVTVDDKFFVTQSKKHAFVRLCTDETTNEREIWPLLIEKAYAKFHGSYSNIEGGLVHTAMEELTNGAGSSYSLRDKSIEQMFNTGELWTKMLFWRARNYLMGAGSPSGSDTDVSSLGIVQGHAYSILDVATIDGNNLIQLRNPWGDDTEWKGAWGDSSDTWNEKRKREAYARMKDVTGRIEEIGKADGIFWMSFNDFYLNFDQLSLCRFFDKEYTEVFFESEWSKVNNTAGGCSNYDSVGYNPQMNLVVEAKDSSVPVEVFIQLNVQGVSSQDKKFGIGFEMYQMKGEKVKDRRVPSPSYTNDGGYKISNAVSFDGAMKSTGDNPLTVLATTFKPDCEAKFRFTVHFKHAQGTVKMTKL